MNNNKNNKNHEATIGDFLAWANKNKWWLRGFDEIHRVDTDDLQGWGFTHCTNCGFISDEDIRKEIPEKTEREWGRWGR